MDLSIIIVTYNSQNDIDKCLKSIIEKTVDLDYEICVVDNASTDRTIDIVNKFIIDNKNIHLYKAENNGFNAGNNIGIKNSEGEYIALLNPDTILLNNAFKIILDNMKKNKKSGACGAALFDENMNLCMSHGSFPKLKEALLRCLKIRNDEKYYLADMSKKVMNVEFPSGADFVFRRELIDKIGFMDTDYFIYFDETDYALKIIKEGYRNYLFTDAKIIHAQGRSTEGNSEFARKMFCESFVTYLGKNVGRFEAKALIFIYLIKFGIKNLLSKIRKKRNNEIKNEYDKYRYIYRNIK